MGTLNVRGLRNQVKRRSIFSFLKDQNCDIFLLQEKFSDPKDESIWKSEWGGAIFFPRVNSQLRGFYSDKSIKNIRCGPVKILTGELYQLT